MTRAELIKKLADVPKDRRAAVACALIGHSDIIETCFGYVHCGRCDAQIGDSLGGIYSNESAVIVGHACATCKKNFKKLTWKDKFLAKNPFPAKARKRA